MDTYKVCTHKVHAHKVYARKMYLIGVYFTGVHASLIAEIINSRSYLWVQFTCVNGRTYLRADDSANA